MENSFKKFNLSEEILKALELLKYENPTKVQEETIPLVLDGKDVIVKSQTGSGKTAAFGIPICENILIEEREPQALILTPTRELCVQVMEDLNNIGRFKRIRCAAVFGKQPFNDQVRDLKQRVHIVVGTPGRIQDHITRGTLNVSNIKHLVIDESDKMLNMGFIEQVEGIIKELPANRITLLFSATMPEEIEKLCKRYMIDAKSVRIESKDVTVNTIEQLMYKVMDIEKFDLLNKLLYIENPDSCILFCSTKETVDRLARKMKNNGYFVEGLHGGMLQDVRLEVMKKFKRGEYRFLVSTDVAGRGIDVESLSLIINYDVPVEKESYVHRIGRTGRAGKEGKAITLVSPEEERIMKEIEEYIGYSIPQGKYPNITETEEARAKFEAKNKEKPKVKAEKGSLLNKNIMKLYIGAGKKKKIRPGDIVGAITSFEGISPDNIGVIDIQDYHSYVDILDGKGKLVLENLKDAKIKGKAVKVEKASK